MEPTPTWYASDTKLHSNPPSPHLLFVFPPRPPLAPPLLKQGCLEVQYVPAPRQPACWVYTGPEKRYYVCMKVCMVSCACGGFLCYYSCWYNECFWELMAVTKQELRKWHRLPMSFSMLDLLFVQDFRDARFKQGVLWCGPVVSEPSVAWTHQITSHPRQI